MAKNKNKPKTPRTKNSAKSEDKPPNQVPKPYPRATLEEALKIPLAIKDKNGGNPWSPDDVAAALGVAKGNPRFFYTAAAARDFGLTSGGRDSKEIVLTELGRNLVYAPSIEVEESLKKKAFLNVEKFKDVLEYYKGNDLPEMKYLSNTLTNKFKLHSDTHEEFSRLFRENCEYLQIGSGFSITALEGNGEKLTRTEKKESFSTSQDLDSEHHREVITLAEPEIETGLHCFIIMPFRERDPIHSEGFFDEVLRSLIAPAGRKAGFTVTTANRQGTEVIQSTIVNDLLNADLVVADLTEHNPNVLFELGMRMANDKPVALIRAKGTGEIFDVDNMLRVFDYDPNLWSSTVERDLPKLTDHIKATWENRESLNTYMKLLRRTPGERQLVTTNGH